MTEDRKNAPTGGSRKKPALELGAALVGLLLTLGLIGFIGWEAFGAREAGPPSITIGAERVLQVPGGYVVEISAVNHGPATASAVEVEGTLKGPAPEPERSHVTLDYVPGHSERRAGLYFTRDPRAGQLELRATGYARP